MFALPLTIVVHVSACGDPFSDLPFCVGVAGDLCFDLRFCAGAAGDLPFFCRCDHGGLSCYFRRIEGSAPPAASQCGTLIQLSRQPPRSLNTAGGTAVALRMVDLHQVAQPARRCQGPPLPNTGHGHHLASYPIRVDN